MRTPFEKIKGSKLLLALLVATVSSPPAFAEDDDGEGFLEEVIVTGVSRSATRLDSSISVSSLDTDDIADFAPTNSAEIFRNLPGIRAEGSGGEGGNAQIAVRGLPVAAGGAKFLLLQEDGLPVMQFGDIAFGTADSFIRHDYTIGKIESVRGGSASTLASNSPGGIINIISKTGEQTGGSLGLTLGLDYDHFRTDFEYGSPIGDGWRAHIGGFFRQGEGPREAGYDGNSGGQVKANVTREFDTGYARLYFKKLDDKAITYLPMPISSDGGSLPGFDSIGDTPHSAFLISDQGLGPNNELITTDFRDGVNTDLTRIGAEFSFDLDSGWNVSNRLQNTSLTGGFISPFTAGVGPAQAIADGTIGAILNPGFSTFPELSAVIDASPGATLVYANGPNAGRAFDMANANGNGLAMQANIFNVTFNDFGSYANDFRISKTFDNATLTLGYYKAQQDIRMSWHWNSYLMEVRGDNAALLDLVDASGTQISQNGLYAYGVPTFGNCCQRDYDSDYVIDAPYFDLSLYLNRLTLDFSFRLESGKARGDFTGSIQSAVDVNRDGIISPNEISVSGLDTANRQIVNYDWDYESYSAGANFALTEDSAVFGRISRGGRANADRLLFGIVQPDGSVRDDDAVDEVDQLEIGYKRQGRNYGIFATFFLAETEEQNFEVTSGRFLNRDYEAMGLELEGAVQWGNFSLNGTATWTDAEIVADAITPAQEGNTPRRQPEFLYTLTPAYTAGRFRVGANIIGATEAFSTDDNDLEFDAFTQVNGFVYYQLADSLTLSLNVNNLFDEEAVTEAEEGTASVISAPGTAADGLSVIRGRTYAGTSATVTLKYEF